MNNTELEIIHAVYKFKSHLCTSYDLGVPNCYTSHDNEADLFFIRKSGLCDEIEVKVSRSDLLADAKKIVKIRECTQFDDETQLGAIDTTWIEEHKHIPYLERNKMISPWRKVKLAALRDGDMDANYFWYAIKPGIGDLNDIPDWAGLIIIRDDGTLFVQRPARRLHKNKMSAEKRYGIARKLAYRFWKSEHGLGN